MDIDRILTSAPVNKAAARAVARRRGLESPATLSREELISLIAYQERKLRLLKHVLRITSKAQHVNMINAIKRGRLGRPGVGMARLTANPRAALEYKLVGEQIQRMCTRLSELKAERRAAAQMEDA